MTKSLPTPELLRKLLRYEAGGKLFWRARTPDMFADGNYTAERSCNNWNARLAGKEAFASDCSGYRHGAIFCRPLYAHRVIWAMETGAWPEFEIDHINGVRDDNRIENLRGVTRQDNGKNMKMPCTNTSGHMGVYWDNARGKWVAYIKVRRVKIHLGYFSDKSDAIDARKSAEIEHGFHENHGR